MVRLAPGILALAIVASGSDARLRLPDAPRGAGAFVAQGRVTYDRRVVKDSASPEAGRDGGSGNRAACRREVRAR